MSEGMLGCKVTIVVDMMLTLVTMRHNGNSLRLRVVVEGNGYHHWQIHQHQQPRKPYPSIIEMTHYPKPFYHISLIFQRENQYLIKIACKDNVFLTLFPQKETTIKLINKMIQYSQLLINYKISILYHQSCEILFFICIFASVLRYKKKNNNSITLKNIEL